MLRHLVFPIFMKADMDLGNVFELGMHPSANRSLILVVEGDEINLSLVTHALRLFGLAQISTLKGKEVMGLTQTYKPDLILLDIVLPDLSGLDVLQALQQNYETRSIPVVAMTALSDLEKRQQLLNLGFSDCLQKPYTIAQLETILLKNITSQNITSQNIIQMQSAS
jgi:two-component system, cell cycle response regulator DivK